MRALAACAVTCTPSPATAPAMTDQALGIRSGAADPGGRIGRMDPGDGSPEGGGLGSVHGRFCIDDLAGPAAARPDPGPAGLGLLALAGGIVRFRRRARHGGSNPEET